MKPEFPALFPYLAFGGQTEAADSIRVAKTRPKMGTVCYSPIIPISPAFLFRCRSIEAVTPGRKIWHYGATMMPLSLLLLKYFG